MPTVSLNAFLKILSKASPQKTQEYGRYLTPGGYDFYWMLKEAARARTVGKQSFAECSQPILKIDRTVEKKHNLAALKSLDKWLVDEKAAGFFEVPLVSVKSPGGFLTVKLEPTFGYTLNGKRRLVHTWASQTASLSKHALGCGLYLLKQNVCAGEFSDCTPTILDLGKRHLAIAEAFHPMVGAMAASELAWADGFFNSAAKAA
jgi:hypothetical protein